MCAAQNPHPMRVRSCCSSSASFGVLMRRGSTALARERRSTEGPRAYPFGHGGAARAPLGLCTSTLAVAGYAPTLYVPDPCMLAAGSRLRFQQQATWRMRAIRARAMLLSSPHARAVAAARLW